MNSYNQKKSGFTLIELTLVITFLSIMFTMVMLVFLSILRFYVFAGYIRNNQANGRETLDLIARDIRFGKVISPANSNTISEICIFSPSDRRIISIKKGSGSDKNNLNRSVYRYTSPNAPTVCPTGSTDLLSTNKINSEDMFVTEFNARKTSGASFEVNSKASAVIIEYEFLSGRPTIQSTPSGPNLSCDPANIYCTKLKYQTAINFRAGD